MKGHKHGNWDKFQSVVQEYFDLGHAEQVLDQDMSKVPSSVFLYANAFSNKRI